jgi:hypothetical protein
MKYLVQKPLVPLAEISRTLIIPESTLRDWIRKGKIVIESAARSYRKSALNLVDLNSLARELDRDTEELARELSEKDVKIFIRTLTRTEKDQAELSSQTLEAHEPEGVYGVGDSLEDELGSLFRELKRYHPGIGDVKDLSIDSLAGYLKMKPEALMEKIERERRRRRSFVRKLLRNVT